jgi:serine/threonine protein kinase
MITRAATIESDPEPAAEAAIARERGGVMKFQYASGSRPLEGFVIKRGIGRGGFGEVYFATSDAGKELALKHIERNLEVELRGVGQCLNLKHPNLIDLYDIRYDDTGDAWVVMEYVAGASLKDTIDRNPNGLPLDQVNFWFRGIAAGVAYLHQHGIVHRDLKPGNIFEDSGYVKIGDYGLSKFISTSRRSGQTESVGTFHYMAPEIGKGVYGKEIDIYALGIVLYEMLTGRTPFDGESSQEIIMKHLTADPDLSGIAQPYRGIIQRALQKDPEKRYHNAADMLAALTPAPSAGSKPGPGNPGAVSSRLEAPYYIGDESEGIEFGPLQVHPEKAVPLAEVVHASTVSQLPDSAQGEPIAQAVRHGFSDLAHWWRHSRMNTPLKVCILLAVALLAMANGEWLVPAAVVLGSVYLVYLGIRLVVNAGRTFPAASVDQGELPFKPLPRDPGWQPLSWEQHGRLLLCEKTAGDQIGELTGSMLASAAIAGVLALVMNAIGGRSMDDSADPLAGPTWLWLMTTLGAWLVLGAGKWCERSAGEMVKRRLGMLVLGLVMGAVAFAASQYLMVELGHRSMPRNTPIARIFRDLYSSTGEPGLAAFMAYFGAVFLTIGWWKQCDPLRSSRLRIAPILLAVLAAWLWQLVIPFPQPWGFMLVAGIAIATQLSAPWLSPAQRTAAIARRAQGVA